MRAVYLLYGFGLLLLLTGIGYLAVEYVGYLSQGGQLAALVLLTAMLYFLGRHFEARGW